MEICVKVGSSRYPTGPLFEKCTRDGHILSVDRDGFKWGKLDQQHHVVLRVAGNFDDLSSTQDSTFIQPGVSLLHKFTSFYNPTSQKFKWEVKEFEHKFYRKYFIDFAKLLADRLIIQGQYDAIYNREKNPGVIELPLRSLENIARDEMLHNRTDERKNMAVASGTYSIGAALDYAKINLAAADIDTTLTGNLTFEHNEEETACDADHQITEDLSTYTLKFTCQSGDEHGGDPFGDSDGARINCTTYREVLDFSVSASGSTIIAEKMGFDIAGNNNQGVLFDNYDGTAYIRRLVVKGDADSGHGIDHYANGTFYEYNNIIYGLSGDNGIQTRGEFAGDAGTFYWYNNTIAKCGNGIIINHADVMGTYIVKNNLCQGNTTADYNEQTGGFDTHAYNVSEDATSPDIAYRSLNCHDGNSCFEDYANNDYKLIAGGDELGTLDDGEDLSGTFTDDIIGQTRTTWYIGASEYVAAGGVAPTGVFYGPFVGPMGGPI